MSLVVLMSGGLDSSLCAALAKESGIDVIPVFINYGQRAALRELAACRGICQDLGLMDPVLVDLQGFGVAVPSGLTSADLALNEDAFLPGRNLVMLVAAAGVAYSRGASGVVIGLLTQQAAIFPDQTQAFISAAETAIEVALGQRVHILAPLGDVSKATVMKLASERSIRGTYSCHAGTPAPCGECVSCREIASARNVMEV